MQNLHIANGAGRDATVHAQGITAPKLTNMSLPDRAVSFARFIATSESGLDEALSTAHGAGYGQALVDDDPEVDIELVGRRVGATDRVFLSGGGDILYASPKVVEIISNPDGTERMRREPQDTPANVDELSPARWTGRKMSKNDALRRFAFRRTLQLTHVDGLTYDFLYEMAKSLQDEGVVVRIGGGEKGRKPLVLRFNGSPYQGFLEGRVEGAKYKLLLHLTNLELKRPEA